VPPDAALLRLAMDTRPGQMMEGEISTPDRAREIYETIVSRQLDPALVEHVSGDVYRLRAFPVPASGRKTVLLVFDHRLGSSMRPRPRAP
jgi:hypothetical protein